MEPITLIYTILGILMFFSLLVVLIIIAGRDIYFAFYRRFIPKGSDVFIINNNRHIDRYYKTAKDGVFKVRGMPYLTNPNKVLGISDEMAKDVRQSMDRSLKGLKGRILKLENKREGLETQLSGLKNTPSNQATIAVLNGQIATLDGKIAQLSNKIEKREESYVHQRRSAYLYIENDPVPKDLFEWYTELDSVQLDNVLVRVQTKDPRNLKDLESSLVWIKRFLIFAIIAGAVAAYFAFQSNSAVQQIAESVGVTIRI